MRSTGQNFSQARLPLLHRLSHLVHVAVPVINRRDAGYRSGHVIEQFLRDVDWRAERREVCRERAAKVVNRPRRNSASFIEHSFRSIPSGEDSDRLSSSALSLRGE